MQAVFKIKTSEFEGPLGLLLDLVEKRKLFINDFSLAEVTEDYLAHVKKLSEDKSKVAEISSFIVIAATLILIKSKSLIPNLDLTSAEEGNIDDLKERLRQYEIFRKLSANIKLHFGRNIIFAPEERKNSVVVFLPDKEITRERMMTLACEVANAMPKPMRLTEVPVKKIVSLGEMIDRLTQRIENTMKISFRDFTGQAKTREEKITVIVGFLAMLELVRRGILEARQEENFEDIMIEKIN